MVEWKLKQRSRVVDFAWVWYVLLSPHWTLISIMFSIVIDRFVCLTLTELEGGYCPLPFLIAWQRIFSHLNLSELLEVTLCGTSIVLTPILWKSDLSVECCGVSSCSNGLWCIDIQGSLYFGYSISCFQNRVQPHPKRLTKFCLYLRCSLASLIVSAYFQNISLPAHLTLLTVK